jgi:hypothetical protein
MVRYLAGWCALALVFTQAIADETPKSVKKPPAIQIPGYTTMRIEGFTVFVSDETRAHLNDAKFERKPLEVLELELKGLGRVMPPKMLKVLQTIKIFVEWDDPESKPKNGGTGVAVARYWYDAGRGMGMALGGRDPRKANNIEILNMAFLTGKWQPGKTSEQIVLLHEMCHAIHSHLLGNDNVAIKAAYSQAM